MAHLAPWAPVLIAALLVLACLWRAPRAQADEEPAPVRRPRFVFRSPPTAPELADLDPPRRAAGRG